jgi:hypothetical protein
MNMPYLLRRFRHVALPCLLAFVSAAIPIAAAADDLECGSEVVTAKDPSIPRDLALAVAEEVCGWGTHDSAAPPTYIAANAAAPDLTVDSSITIIATAALASAGVAVEQIVEPFALVGPLLGDSVERVQKFQLWWDIKAAVEQANVAEAKLSATDDIQDDIDAIAAEEPIDAGHVDAIATQEPAGAENLEMIVDQEPVTTAVDTIAALGPVKTVGIETIAAQEPVATEAIETIAAKESVEADSHGVIDDEVLAATAVETIVEQDNY